MRIAIFDNEEWTDRHKSERGCFEMLSPSMLEDVWEGEGHDQITTVVTI